MREREARPSGAASGVFLEDWYQDFAPADILLYDAGTDRQLRQPSLLAVSVCPETGPEKAPYAERRTAGTLLAARQVLAAGDAARAYEGAPGVMVFSPLRNGQIAHYTASQCLFRTLLRRLRPRRTLLKPDFYIHIQERTTEVEERAFIDAALQLGALHVFLSPESLPSLLKAAREKRSMRGALVLDIVP